MPAKRPIFVVGPSGVGKTEALKVAAKQLPTCVCIDVDEAVHRLATDLGIVIAHHPSVVRGHIADEQLFLGFGLLAAGELAGRSAGKTIVADLGAGFQCARSAENLTKIGRVVLITAAPEIAHSRSLPCRGERTLEQYAAGELQDAHRSRVYQQALPEHVIDSTNLSSEETGQRLADLIERLISE